MSRCRFSILLVIAIGLAVSCERDCAFKYPLVNPERAITSLADAERRFGAPTKVEPYRTVEMNGTVQRMAAHSVSVLHAARPETIDVYHWRRQCLGRTREAMWIFVERATLRIIAIHVQQNVA